MQAKQPRRRSRWSATVVDLQLAVAHATQSMRPRGESISSPQLTQVGQVGEAEAAVDAVVFEVAAAVIYIPPTKRPGASRPRSE